MPTNSLQEHIDTLLASIPKEQSHLLPALWAVADGLGWIDADRITAIAQTMNLPVADVYGVASFYALLPTEPHTATIRICTDLICTLAGSEELYRQAVGQGLDHVLESPCLGRCEKSPAALVNWTPVSRATIEAISEVMRHE